MIKNKKRKFNFYREELQFNVIIMIIYLMKQINYNFKISKNVHFRNME